MDRGASTAKLPTMIREHSIKGFLISMGGILVVALIILGVVYVANTYVLHDPTDPLTSKGGLDRQQGIGGK